MTNLSSPHTPTGRKLSWIVCLLISSIVCIPANSEGQTLAGALANRAVSRVLAADSTKILARAAKFKGPASRQGPVEVLLSRQRHPQTAAHISEALRLGQPSVLTLERAGAKGRRKDALRHLRKKWPEQVRGRDRDEYPPAMSSEGGANADVRYIRSGDNRRAGTTVERQLRPYPDGTRFRVNIMD